MKIDIPPDENNVVDVKFGDVTLEQKTRDYSGCRHVRIVVDSQLRTVECKECSTILDPVEMLVDYATGERRLQNRKDIRSDLIKSISELKAEEKRIKARIRTAKKRGLI